MILEERNKEEVVKGLYVRRIAVDYGPVRHAQKRAINVTSKIIPAASCMLAELLRVVHSIERTVLVL